jgi:large subunit ribosomal protein L25
MSKVFINATKRDELGSNKTKQLRNKGFVPGTLYGGHMDSTPITMNKVEVDRFFADNNIGSKVFVNLEGKEIMAFAKSMQKDVFGKGILHVDLQALTKTDKFKMSVRLNYIGKESLPVGSVVQELVNIIEVETLPENMTETINVDVSELKFGDILKVADLSIMQDQNFKVFTAPEITIFSLAHPSAAEPVEVAVAVATEEPQA